MTFWIYVTGEEASRKEEKKCRPCSNAEVQQSQSRNQKKVKQAKENWITDRCQEIDSGMGMGNRKVAFNTLKLMTQ